MSAPKKIFGAGSLTLQQQRGDTAANYNYRKISTEFAIRNNFRGICNILTTSSLGDKNSAKSTTRLCELSASCRVEEFAMCCGWMMKSQKIPANHHNKVRESKWEPSLLY